jgi:anti-anti-sigma factor
LFADHQRSEEEDVLQTSILTRQPARAAHPPQFSRSRSGVEHASTVIVTGELDIAAVPRVDRALRRAEADAALVVLDLRELEFIDASGAHLLLAADLRIRGAGGRLVVVRGGPEVKWILALIGIDRELEFVDWPAARRGSACRRDP